MSSTASDLQFMRTHIHQLWVALMRNRQKLCEMEAQWKLARAGREPALPVKFRAQYGEDAVIWDIFEGATSGFYIEAGAFDGVHFSVTYALEAVGWTGLLVEPIAERARECRENRPGSRVEHGALGRRDAHGTVQFQIVGQGHGAEGMLSSVAAPGPSAAPNARVVEVPITSLAALLADHKGEIDVAVIDVEGAEKDVLDGLDLRRTRPKLLAVEDNSFGKDAALYAQIESAGYVLGGRLNINRFYVRSDLPALVARTKSVLAFE